MEAWSRRFHVDQWARGPAHEGVPDAALVDPPIEETEEREQHMDQPQAPPEHHIAQRVDQGLQLHTGHAYPLSQSGTWNRQARSTENRLLAVQRKMIGKLRDHDVGK